MALWLGFAGPAWADVLLTPGESAAFPPEAMEYLEERSALTPAEALAADMQLVLDSSLNFGTRAHPVWVRFRVRNAAATPGEWLLSFNRAVLSVLEVYRTGENGDMVKLMDVDEPGTEGVTLRRYGTLALPFSLDAGSAATLLVRFQGPNTSALPLTIEDEAAFLEGRRDRVILFLIVFVGVLTLIAYNTAMHLLTAERSFLYYSVAQALLLTYFAHLQGMTTAFLWPDRPAFGAPLAPLLGAASVVAMLAFARNFLDTRRRAPHWDRLLAGLQILGLAWLPLAALRGVGGWPAQTVVYLPIYLASALTWIALPVLAVQATWRWERWHWPLVAAWSSMSLFVFFTLAVLSGWLPVSNLHHYLYGAVAYVEAGFLAIALALRMRAIRHRALSAELALNDSVRRQLAETRRVDRLLQERSAALSELSNQEELVRATSHDSRQMLGALRQAAHAIRDGGPAADLGVLIEDVAEHLDHVLTTAVNGSSGAGVGEELLAIDRVPAAALLEAVRMVFARDAQQAGLRLTVAAHDVALVTDRALLMRLLCNLVSNAIRYTPQGKVLITARRRAGTVRLRVQDTGIGLTDAEAASLLAPTRPATRFESAAAVPGSGSGWPILRDLARRLGAELFIARRPGGTSVGLDLPTYDEPAVVAAGWLKLPAAPSDLEVLDARRASAAPCVDLWLVDVDASADPEAELARHSARMLGLVAATWDRGGAFRRTVARHARFLIYKPITADMLKQLAALARRRAPTSKDV